MADEYTPEVAQAFKENLVRVTHEWAEEGRQCDTFDQILLRRGLPGREEFHRRWDWVPTPPIVGEATEEEFEAWKAETESYFWQQADEYGLGEAGDDLLEAAGFRRRPAYVYRNVVVEGTFTVPLQVHMRETDDIINHVKAGEFARGVYNVLRYGSDVNGGGATVEWKARVAENQPTS